jgi:hypothetical protein
MSNNAGSLDEAAANQNNDRATQALGQYGSDMDTYTSNINSAIAAGNPYLSKDYKTNQNLETSGALHSANDAAQAKIADTVNRTGTNSAAVANEVASSGRDAARDMTAYNASRDTANQDKWLQERDNLYRDQLAGANSEAGVYGTSLGANTSDLKSMTDAKDAESEMWAQLGEAGIKGAGTALGAI